jgi:hypothetical protein
VVAAFSRDALILLDVALEVDYTVCFETHIALAKPSSIGTSAQLPWTRIPDTGDERRQSHV